MEGTVITHAFSDTIDAFSGQEIYELRDEKGLPVWFTRYFYKDVCMSGLCNMVSVWLFWDAAGNYLGLQPPEDEPLTKSDHTEFERADYEKLDEILGNPASILHHMDPEDLTVEIDPDEMEQVDGYTAATQPTLAHILVKDAVYTCHTLWHTVYGHTRDTINEMLFQRADKDYLTLMFENGKPEYSSWAIRHIENKPEYHADFYKTIAILIKSENGFLAQQALEYFQPHMLIDVSAQKLLLSIISEVVQQKKYDIIWKLTEIEKTDVEIVVQLLEKFENQEIGVGALNPLYRLIHQEHFKDQRIESILKRLASNENAYIRFQTNTILRNAYN